MSYTVIPSDLKRDRDRILELWQKNLFHADPPRYTWLYETGTATGWIVDGGEEGAVGSAGVMQRRFRAFGEDARAGQAVDLNVAPNHRTVGPAMLLQRATIAAVKQRQVDWLYAISNHGAELVQRRVGYRVLAPLERWVRPLHVGNSLRNRLNSPLLRAIAPAIANPLLFLRSAISFRPRRRKVRFETSDHFDDRFDLLWEIASPRHAVIGERTSTYLNWRFCQRPGFRHKVFCMSCEERMLAYLVYHHREGIVHVGDFFSLNPPDLGRLLGEFVHQMRRKRVEAVATVFMGSDWVRRLLKKQGFWRTSTDRNALIYTDSERFAPLLDVRAWYLTQADMDGDH